jgi:hypothetical protein
MEHDDWLDPLRRRKEFKELLATAHQRHQQAVETFNQLNGTLLLS